MHSKKKLGYTHSFSIQIFQFFGVSIIPPGSFRLPHFTFVTCFLFTFKCDIPKVLVQLMIVHRFSGMFNGDCFGDRG